jgi:hypothetical protein
VVSHIAEKKISSRGSYVSGSNVQLGIRTIILNSGEARKKPNLVLPQPSWNNKTNLERDRILLKVRGRSRSLDLLDYFFYTTEFLSIVLELLLYQGHQNVLRKGNIVIIYVLDYSFLGFSGMNSQNKN